MSQERPRVRFASQTYSWQMSGRWSGRLGEISNVVGQSGFEGLEPEVCMMDGFGTSESLTDLVEKNNLQLAAIALVLDWRGEEETEDERREADRVIDLMRVSVDGRLVLVQRPAGPGADRAGAQDRLVACMSAVAHRAADKGVVATFHPNSPAASIVRTEADYDRVLPKLPAALGWTPDTGHLAAGGMAPLDMIHRYRDLVNHIHLKDVDAAGQWAPNGQGVVDMVGVVKSLTQSRYSGWITVEDESPSASSDPNSAAFRNGKWVAENLRPLVEKERHQRDEVAAQTDA